MYVSSSSANIISNTFRGNIASVEGTGFGGGLYTSRSPATIIGNMFVSNTASIAAAGSGGGLMLSYNSAATVTNNIIHDNIGSTASSGYGGGVRVWGSPALLQNNTIYNNIASTFPSGYGGGISVYNSLATLSNNVVTGNTASSTGYGSGGGISLSSGSPVLSRNHVAGNSAYAGGGIRLSGSNATLTDNFVHDNTAGGQGGGLYINAISPVLVNTVVTDNALSQTTGTGAGIYIIVGSPRLVHCTVTRNTGGDGSGIYVTGFEWSGTYYSSTVLLTNSILVSQTVGITVSAGDTANLNSTLWHDNGSDWNGTGTINHTRDHCGDPAFATDGYHLTGVSAAINQGIDAGLTSDIDGDTRPYGAGYDLGADEWVCCPLTGMGITGPTAGYTRTTYIFNAVVIPTDATLPITYTWTPAPSTGQGTGAASYTWNVTGPQVLTVTAENCGGAVMATHTITIEAPQSPCPKPLTGVGITGPTSGYTGTTYTFVAVVTPTDATVPMAYTWTPVPSAGQGAASASYAWNVIGPQVLTITAENCGGTVAATHTITVTTKALRPWCVYLPLVMRNQ